MTLLKFKNCICVLLIASLAIVSCSKGTNPKPTPTTLPTIDPNVDIYVVGTSKGSNGDVATYWKNGVATILGNTGPSFAYSIILEGTDVYTTGYIGASAVSYSGAFWKNGIQTTFPSENSSLLTMALDGADLYTAGSMNNCVALWKNGILFPIQGEGSSTNSISAINAIAINGSDVYLAGYLATGGDNCAAAYWKNGIVTKLTSSTSVAVANAIAVNGTDIYVVGYVVDNNNRSVATCWKNGVATTLDSPYSQASTVIYNGSDMYITGYDSNGAIYWKNGVATSLAAPGGASIVSTVAFKGNDIYVAGYNSNGAIYWKNGISVQLAKCSNINYITGVAIVPH
jgi:hypothetical protein